VPVLAAACGVLALAAVAIPFLRQAQAIGAVDAQIDALQPSVDEAAALRNRISGSGNDAIAANGGTNVLDGGTGSNFLVGGSGTDTFFVDDRGPTADIWSTVNGFHTGDAATIWGVTPNDFNLNWVDGQGAAGFTGLTLHATATGKPTASLTLAGYTTADLTNGRLSMSFGTDPASGSAYMYVHGNS
jgi:Ca2+-binding RTX toxin-like protein